MAATKEEVYKKVSFAPNAKLPLQDKLIYCAGSGMGTNISWVAFGYYLMYFYTDILGITPVIAGSIILFARIWDCITDMIMGWAVDHFNLKWGKYRSWVIISLIPMTLLFIGVFTVVPGLGTTGKIIWAVITYGNFGAVGATLCYIPMSAQIMNMTKNVEERASMAGIKQVFVNAGQIIVSSAFMPMVGGFGGGAKGFFWVAVLIAAFTMILLYGVINITRKYELNLDGSYREHLLHTEHESVLKQIKTVFNNRPAVVLVAGIAIQYLLQAVRSGMIVYIFNYYFGLPDFLPIAMLLNTVMMVVGALLLKPVIHAIKDSNRAFVITMGLSVIFNIVFWGICSSLGVAGAAASIQYGVLFFVFGINGLLTGLHYAYMGVLLPNVIEYGAWKNKKYQPGMIYSFNAICLTLGGALGGQFMGMLLNGAGYVANQTQTAETLRNLLLIAFIVPAVLTLIQLIIQLFFGLSDKQCNQYALENQTRVKGESAT